MLKYLALDSGEGCFWFIFSIIYGCIALFQYHKGDSFGLMLFWSVFFMIPVIKWENIFNTDNKKTQSEVKNTNNQPILNNKINTSPAKEKTTRTIETYTRDKHLKDICITRAQHKCELNASHQYFKNQQGYDYVEAHHIIPLQYQKDFSFNIDSLENLICLCPVCHKALHYGSIEIRQEILKIIYNIKQPFNIPFEQLLKYYSIYKN